jgi:D-alanine-D-alanine ligase
MKQRIRVGVVFGGRSGEHEVSLMSARSVMSAIDKDKYEVVPIGIDKHGRWLTDGDAMPQLLSSETAAQGEAEAGSLYPTVVNARRELVPGTQQTGFPRVDVIFPVLHGPYGEDGTVQGLLELADIPYVGAGVVGSAVGMDKAIFKDVMIARGLPIPKHVVVMRSEWESGAANVVDNIERQIAYPVFTKPANLGSSVGICKCHNRDELVNGLRDASLYDRKLLVEAAVPSAREIEVSVLGNEDPIASIPGEIIPSREFYSYESKYMDSGDQASKLLIPAPLPRDLSQQVRELALKVYRAIDCAGMARVDFLLAGSSGEVYVNELNTIPGFTAISMYPKLWEATGIPYPELIDRLIALALERYEDGRRSLTSYHPGSKAGED